MFKPLKKIIKTLLIFVVIAVPLSALGSWLLMTQSCEGQGLSDANSLRPVPECLLLPGQAMAVLKARMAGDEIAPEYGNFARFMPPQSAAPIAHAQLARHPLMAAGGNNMHNDAYISDVNDAPGPLGINTRVQSLTQGFGGYGTMTFDNRGRIIAVFGNARQFRLEMLDADTLEILATYELPPRSLYFPLQGVMPWKYIGAGMYFYLDEQNRAVVPTTRNTLLVVQAPEDPATQDFELVKEYDLSSHVVELPWPKLDSVAWVMPEWPSENQARLRYWYATIEGMVGVVDAESGAVSTWKVPDEIIENSFAVGEEGVFMMSDRAMYRLQADADNNIAVAWRQPYDRGPGQKAGHITRGSGTSVSLVGEPEQGLVVMTDNAEPRIHLELLRRGDGEKVCRVPLFADGKSGTDLSALAFEHADANGTGNGHFSVMVENNYGHHVFPMPDPHPGIARVDAVREKDGSYRCDLVWQTEEAGIAAAKMSLDTGLIYMYSYDSSPAQGGYFTAIDFRSGEVAFRQHTGMGHGYNAWQGVLFLHPSNGALYSTTIFGLIKIQDQL